MPNLSLSILLAFLTVISLTKSQNINPKHYQIHEFAPPNGFINYQPHPTDLQKLVALKYVRGPSQHRPRHAPPPPRKPKPIVVPETPHLHPPRKSRPPPMM
ncbi:unnamed protein product [Trifolium pratense]|uniref:Uncharacterized protein n=1 Tax=Trifolium pratense TaxID=57577 RepID=A0ACB0IWA4_TRIPR|nr:unnamed protein product [Trifolium pratense]